MNERIKMAFDVIHAEEALKQNTLQYLKKEAARRGEKKPRRKVFHPAAALACCMILAVFGLFSYRMYFSEVMYVDVDINPSVELSVNRFNRVIGVYGYNADSEDLLARLTLKHKLYDQAVTLLTRASMESGFLADGGLVSVTLQSNRSSSYDNALKTMETCILSVAQNHHASVRIQASVVDSETREHAHALNLSPAKYLAILALQDVDPTASMESCREHTMEEIYTLTQECGKGHHGQGHHGEGHHCPYCT
jgi:hypothetical protein